jgi:hypothetical protein
MSPRHPTISFNRNVFAFLFVLCAFFSSTLAWAVSLDNLSVEMYTTTDASIKYQLGTLSSKEGFIPSGTFSNWESYIGPVSAADLAAINGKPVIKLSLWLSFCKYYPKFSLSQATYTIEDVPYVIVSVKGKAAPATKDTRPILSPISLEWDIEVGQHFAIPLSVSDPEQDDFIIIGGPAGSAFSEPEDINQLPTRFFLWTPTPEQANKIFTVKFKAKETESKKLVSNIVTTKIRVWPAGGQTDEASVSKFNVSTVKWNADVLTLSGKVVLNKIMSAAQRSEFLAKQLDLTLTAGNTGMGLPVGSSPLPLTLLANGNWTVTMPLPAAEVPCQITLSYEGRPAARTVSRAPANCLK